MSVFVIGIRFVIISTRVRCISSLGVSLLHEDGTTNCDGHLSGHKGCYSRFTNDRSTGPRPKSKNEKAVAHSEKVKVALALSVKPPECETLPQGVYRKVPRSNMLLLSPAEAGDTPLSASYSLQKRGVIHSESCQFTVNGRKFPCSRSPLASFPRAAAKQAGAAAKEAGATA